jgi:hypothetical protein
MRLKLITIFLGFTTLLFGITAGVLYVLIHSFEETVYDRELTITSYKKVVDACGKSGGISVENLKTELKKDFEMKDKIGYNGYNDEYFYVLYPKNRAVNQAEIFNFMGFELVLDSRQTFKSVKLYKP